MSWGYKNIPDLRGLCGQRHKRYDAPHPYQDQADWVLGRMEQSVTSTSGRSSPCCRPRRSCPSSIYANYQPPFTIPASHTQIPPVAVSKQQVLVTVPAPRSAVPNPTPRQLDRELATVKAKINVLEQRHVQLQAIHQQEVTRRLEGAAKAIGQGLIRAPTTIQINDNQLCLYASDEVL